MVLYYTYIVRELTKKHISVDLFVPRHARLPSFRARLHSARTPKIAISHHVDQHQGVVLRHRRNGLEHRGNSQIGLRPSVPPLLSCFGDAPPDGLANIAFFPHLVGCCRGLFVRAVRSCGTAIFRRGMNDRPTLNHQALFSWTIHHDYTASQGIAHALLSKPRKQNVTKCKPNKRSALAISELAGTCMRNRYPIDHETIEAGENLDGSLLNQGVAP